MLKRLELINFKRHKSLAVDFTDGLNLITGPNYSGKSTILQAILYAFGGPRAVPGGKSVVSTKGGEGPTMCTLIFEIDGQEYTVNRKGSGATVWKGEKLEAKSTSAVSTYLSELLGMDMRRFHQLRYGEQKETEALLTLGAAELHKIIQEVSQVDVVEKVITYCSAVISETKGALSALPEEDIKALEQEVEDLNNELTQAYALLGQLREQAASADKQLEAANAELDIADRQNAETKSRQRARQSMESDLDKLIDRDKELSTLQVRDIKELEQTVAELEPLLAEAMTQQKYAERMVHDLRAAAGSVESLKLRLEDTERLLVGKRAELADMPDYGSVEPDREILAQTTSDKAVLAAKLAELKVARDTSYCPTCKRPYDGDPAHLAETEAEIARIELELPKLESQIRSLSDRIKQTELYLESRRKTEAMIGRFQYTQEAQHRDLEEALATHAELLREDWGGKFVAAGKETAELSARLSEVKPELTQAIQLQAERTEVENRIADISTTLKQLPADFNFIPIEPLENKIEQTRDIVYQSKALYSEAHSNYTGEYAKLSVLKSRLNDARSVDAKRGQLQRRHGTAQGLVKYLRANRDRFVADIWAGIMGYASEFAASSTGGALEQVSRTESGSFAYIENGEEHPVEAASGAQKSIMGLGVQLALAQMLPISLPVLLLDEPGADFDPERALAVTSLLAAEQSQLIMVSHRELDGAVASNTIALGG